MKNRMKYGTFNVINAHDFELRKTDEFLLRGEILIKLVFARRNKFRVFDMKRK